MSPNDRDEPERDAWLREALRHAPDANVEPPRTLNDAILREARTAAATATSTKPAAPRARGFWAAAWAALARPPVAAGFASVMVATLAGLMWWDRPMDETLSRPPAPMAARSPPAAVADVPNGASPDAAPAAAARKPAAPAPQAKERATRALPAPTATLLPAPAPAPSPAPAPEAFQSAEPSRSRQKAALASPADAAAAARDESTSTDAAQRQRNEARSAGSAAAPMALAQPRAAAATAPVTDPAALFADIAAQPQRWSWRRDGEIRPMAPSLQRWLTQLAGTTATRWQSRTSTGAEGDTLRLFRDGELRATLRIDDAGVGLLQAPPANLNARADLAPGEASALRQALAEATR